MAIFENSFIYDKPVCGKDYIPRAEEDSLRKALGEGHNVLLCGAPGSGKTSLIEKVLSETKGVRYFKVSLLSVRDEKGLAEAFSKAFGRKADSANEAMALGGSIARESGCKVTVGVEEFQNLLLCEGSEQLLNAFEQAARKGDCSWIWTGSMVNALDSIFTREHRFVRQYERIALSPIPYPEIEAHIIRHFNVSGKVIEKELIRNSCRALRCDIGHINHLMAICDALSRGYITSETVSEAMRSLLKMHESAYIFTVNSLTFFQLSLLRAILDSQSNLSSEDVILRYSLNSSANVKRVKDALAKKEIAIFPRGSSPRIIDPLLEYWLRECFFA